jgi:mannose-6-phosphate isomerase-like protein (cupin superfamily)
MDAFDLQELSRLRAAGGRLYLEFLRVPDLSAGLYEIPAGGTDPQSPHTEDELYYVCAGRATISVGGEDRPVGAGALVFVVAGVPHRFHSVVEDLSVLVVFGPAEGSRARPA